MAQKRVEVRTMAGRKGRRGWGRIRALPNKSKRYQANYTWPPVTTARHNAPTTFSTRALAEAWLAGERRLIERGEWSPPKERVHREIVAAQTFGDYAKRWIEERNIKESTKREYRREFKTYIADVFGPVPLRALDAATVRAWFAALETTPNGKYSAYKLLATICATAVSDGLLAPNPCQLTVKQPARTIKPVILKPADVAAAVGKLAPQRYAAPALIGAWCGLRWGELGELRRKDVGEAAATITVERGFDHETGCHINTTKSGKGRTVVVPPRSSCWSSLSPWCCVRGTANDPTWQTRHPPLKRHPQTNLSPRYRVQCHPYRRLKRPSRTPRRPQYRERRSSASGANIPCPSPSRPTGVRTTRCGWGWPTARPGRRRGRQ